MRIEDLAAYEAAERRFARAVGVHAVAGGIVTDIRPLYGDMSLPSSLGFHRRGASLPAAIWLHPKTVVFLPPVSRSDLVRRIGMPIDDFVELNEAGVVQPVIGHPTEYADLDFFEPILSQKPPSVWSRGDELAHQFAGADNYWDDARSVVPLAALKSVPWVQEKWRRQYPELSLERLDAQLDVELCTNYVDLCIFGWEPLARRIVTDDDPDRAARLLVQFNELLTYPWLLGMGGAPTYGAEYSESLAAFRDQVFTGTVPIGLGDALDVLLRGLRLEFPNQVSARAVKEFHRQQAGPRLWSAVEELERVCTTDPDSTAIDTLHGAVEAFETAANRAFREARDISFELNRERSGRIASASLKLASVACLAAGLTTVAGLSPALAIISGIGGTSLATRRPFDKWWGDFEDRMTDLFMAAHASKLATHIWWLDKAADAARRS